MSVYIAEFFSPKTQACSVGWIGETVRQTIVWLYIEFNVIAGESFGKCSENCFWKSKHFLLFVLWSKPVSKSPSVSK